jgi:hypothetical protein
MLLSQPNLLEQPGFSQTLGLSAHKSGHYHASGPVSHQSHSFYPASPPAKGIQAHVQPPGSLELPQL